MKFDKSEISFETIKNILDNIIHESKYEVVYDMVYYSLHEAQNMSSAVTRYCVRDTQKSLDFDIAIEIHKDYQIFILNSSQYGKMIVPMSKPETNIIKCLFDELYNKCKVNIRDYYLKSFNVTNE